MAEPLKTTPLTDSHIAQGARMVSFAGFSMPVQYSGGISEEVRIVRNEVGLLAADAERLVGGDHDERVREDPTLSECRDELANGDVEVRDRAPEGRALLRRKVVQDDKGVVGADSQQGQEPRRLPRA